ncbi:MAG: LPXTG cell wall anchor domain-containing protein [Acidimicrobiia bacterium]|nr:LPXTG cell wall anchor domain-containing protein [Acidimicrobiia bacterium]
MPPTADPATAPGGAHGPTFGPSPTRPWGASAREDGGGAGMARRGPTRPGLLLDLAAVGALLSFVAVFFWPLVTGHMFSTVAGVQSLIFPWAADPPSIGDVLQNDSATLNFGWQAFAQEVLQSGSFPFWNPSSFGGYALFANGSSGFANPVRILLALTVGPGPAHELFSILHLAAGGVLAYLLGRDLRLARWGSLLAATAWMLSSWNLGWLHLEVVSPVIAFFPAGLLTVRRAVLRPNLSWVALAAATLAWLLVSTHLLFALVTWSICMLYGAALAVGPLLARAGRDAGAALGRGARAGAAAVLSVGLGAPVLLPTWLMLARSQREPMTYEVLREVWMGRPESFLNTFTPEALPLTGATFNSELVFAGTATALLALVGLFARRRPAASLGRGLAAGVFLVTVGTPLTWLVFTFVPGMDVFRPYDRLVMWWPLAVGLLGGAGLDVLVERCGRYRRWLGAALAVLVVAGTAGQLLDYGRAISPPFPPRDSRYLFPDTDLLAAMREEGTSTAGWPQRHAGLRAPQALPWTFSMLSANTSLAAGLDSATGYDSAVPARSTDVVRVLAGEPIEQVLASGLDAAYFPVLEAGTARLDLLGRAGIGQVAMAPGIRLDEPWAAPLVAVGAEERYRGADGTLVQLPEAGPRLVGGTIVAAGRDDALRTFTRPGFDHTTALLVEQDQVDRLEGVQLPGAPGPAGDVVEATRGTNTARLVVEADRPAWLLVPDGWDDGWSAEVDGHNVPVLRADYSQRAVLVPEGRSEVTFSYRPEGWRPGVAIGVVSLLLCVSGTAVSWRRRRRRGRPAGPGAPTLIVHEARGHAADLDGTWSVE